MYFQDLGLCDYHSGPHDYKTWCSPLLSVGWLEHPHSYSTGPTPPALLYQLESLIEKSWEHYPSFAFRGPYSCSFCVNGHSVGTRNTRSHENLWIPGDGVIYLAPGMITHYIGDHEYRPPECFIKAVLSCPDYGTPGYCAALRAANAGKPPPLLTTKEVAEKWAAERAEMLKRQTKNLS